MKKSFGAACLLVAPVRTVIPLMAEQLLESP
jgi:hypothetical protein